MLYTATTSKRIDSISPGRLFNRATFGRYSSVFMYSLQGTEANTYFVKLLFFSGKGPVIALISLLPRALRLHPEVLLCFLCSTQRFSSLRTFPK